MVCYISGFIDMYIYALLINKLGSKWLFFLLVNTCIFVYKIYKTLDCNPKTLFYRLLEILLLLINPPKLKNWVLKLPLFQIKLWINVLGFTCICLVTGQIHHGACFGLFAFLLCIAVKSPVHFSPEALSFYKQLSMY